MKFIVDAMFGRLARWLRICGYDTLYDVKLRDGRLVMIAKEEGRIVITRDREVYNRSKKMGVQATYIKSLEFLEQLWQLMDEHCLVFRADPERARCPVCNATLKCSNKNDIKAKVPENVIAAYDEFWTCRGCGKVYWKGGHWMNIMDTVEKLNLMSMKRSSG